MHLGAKTPVFDAKEMDFSDLQYGDIEVVSKADSVSIHPPRAVHDMKVEGIRTVGCRRCSV